MNVINRSTVIQPRRLAMSFDLVIESRDACKVNAERWDDHDRRRRDQWLERANFWDRVANAITHQGPR